VGLIDPIRDISLIHLVSASHACDLFEIDVDGRDQSEVWDLLRKTREAGLFSHH
jgi:hypothetical protein